LDKEHFVGMPIVEKEDEEQHFIEVLKT